MSFIHMWKKCIPEALILLVAVCLLLTIASAGVAAQEFDDDGEDVLFDGPGDKTSDVTPIKSGSINFVDGELQFKFENKSGEPFDLSDESVQIYIDSDTDTATGLVQSSYSDDYFSNMSGMGADYNVQVGDGQEALFEWVNTSDNGGDNGFFTARDTVTATQSNDEVIVNLPIDQIGINEGDQIRLKFAYVTDSEVNDGDYDWAPSNADSGGFFTYDTAGTDGESGEINEVDISGEVKLGDDSGNLDFDEVDVEVSAFTDNDNEAGTETVTISGKPDTPSYTITVDGENFNGDGSVEAELSSELENYRLNDSRPGGGDITDIDIANDLSDQDFTLEPAVNVTGNVVVEQGVDSFKEDAAVEFSLPGDENQDTVTVDAGTNATYNATAFADEFESDEDLTAEITNQDATGTSLNKTTVDIDGSSVGVGGQKEENFEVIAPAEVNGTITVNSSTPSFNPDANVELSLAGKTKTKTLGDSDSASYTFTVVESELNGDGTLTAEITNADEIGNDLRLNKTVVDEIDVGPDEFQEENIEIQPPDISVFVSSNQGEPIDVRQNDQFEVSVELSNNLNREVYSISHILEYEEANVNVTDESNIDTDPSVAGDNFAEGSDGGIENKTITEEFNTKVDITGNESQEDDTVVYNATLNITDAFAGSIDYKTVEDVTLSQSEIKAVDENNETINRFESPEEVISFNQTEAFVEFVDAETSLKTKANMIGSEMKVEASAVSPNNGPIKNITLVKNNTDGKIEKLDDIDCDGASTCSTSDDDKSLLTHEPAPGNNTLGGLDGSDTYNLTDKFKLRVYGAGEGDNEVAAYNLSETPIYERGDISSATGGSAAGSVDITDLARLAEERGTETDELPFDADTDEITDNSIYDVNNDGIIDIIDLTIVAREGL